MAAFAQVSAYRRNEMARQEFGPFSFVGPTSWSRRSYVVFADESQDGASRPNIVLAREERNPDESLQVHTWRKLIELGRGVQDFELVATRETTIDGRWAFRALYRWRGEHGPLQQAIAWIDAGDGNALTVTATAFAEHREAFDEFERLLTSLRLVTRESMLVPSSAVVAASPSNAPPPPSEDQAMFGAVPMPGARRSSPSVDQAASARKERP
jgi:hypothetical protein